MSTMLFNSYTALQGSHEQPYFTASEAGKELDSGQQLVSAYSSPLHSNAYHMLKSLVEEQR